MSRQLDGQRRERNFHASTSARVTAHALDWHRAEQLAVAGLQDRDLTDTERDAWRERRAAARRGIARRTCSCTCSSYKAASARETPAKVDDPLATGTAGHVAVRCPVRGSSHRPRSRRRCPLGVDPIHRTAVES